MENRVSKAMKEQDVKYKTKEAAGLDKAGREFGREFGRSVGNSVGRSVGNSVGREFGQIVKILAKS